MKLVRSVVGMSSWKVNVRRTMYDVLYTDTAWLLTRHSLSM